jgi:GT2 family glycosyltransferase
MKIGIVCVNYNNSNVTQKLIQSIEGTYDTEALEIHVVIVDNSSNISIDIAEYSITIKIIPCSNIGYFPGLNIGLEYLKNQSGFIYDFIIIGNNDLFFSSKFWDILLLNKSFLKEHYVISPRITKPNGEEQNPHVIKDLSNKRLQYLNLVYSNRYFFKYFRLFVKLFIPNNLRRKDEISYKVNQFIAQGHGSCYILSKKYINKFNLPEETKLYGEEFFLYHQLNISGLAIYYFHELAVLHDEHSSTNNVLSLNLFRMKKEAFKKELLIRKKSKK